MPWGNACVVDVAGGFCGRALIANQQSPKIGGEKRTRGYGGYDIWSPYFLVKVKSFSYFD